jgi:hypothetical protein
VVIGSVNVANPPDKATAPPEFNFSLIGMPNSKAIRFGSPSKNEDPPPEYRMYLELGVARIGHQWTISVEVGGLPDAVNQHLQAVLIIIDRQGSITV